MMDWTLTRIISTLDFDAPGRQIGELRLRPSDNQRALGHYPVPVCVLKNGDGPTLLLTGGVHGDEYEGPVALLDLMHRLDVNKLNGRLIIFPALNTPAVMAATRCSPLDDGNLNRAFPGDANGSATAQIANMLEAVVMPACDAAIDIHSGGKASEFVPLTMYNPISKAHGEGSLGEANRALAVTFGAPYNWIMGDVNDNRSVNGAAERQQIPMCATELGGGGHTNKQYVDLAQAGIYRVMAHLGIWQHNLPAPPPATQNYQVSSSANTHTASRDGLFMPAMSLGNKVSEGDLLGTLYSVDEVERKPHAVMSAVGGILVSQTRHGLVKRGDFLTQIGEPAGV